MAFLNALICKYVINDNIEERIQQCKANKKTKLDMNNRALEDNGAYRMAKLLVVNEIEMIKKLCKIL